MLDFSISSVNMAILVSNLFIIFLVLIFRNRKVMFRLGLPLLVGFVILICVRMIFPVELLPISHNVYLPDLLTTIVGETRRVRFFHDTVSWWNIFEIVWGCGILYSLLQYIKRNYDCQKYIRKHAVIIRLQHTNAGFYSDQIRNHQKRGSKNLFTGSSAT